MPRASKPLPAATRLRELLDYRPETGDLIWRRRPRESFATRNAFSTWNSRYAGHIAGCLHNAGYIEVAIDKTPYLAHRLIWKMMTGEEPTGIDHIDRNGRNNSWRNLREATNSENMANRTTPSHSQSGVKGVRRFGQKFEAHIREDGRFVHLGMFDTIAEAHAAHCEAHRRIYGKFFSAG